jgi:hypothetical protein
MCACDVFSDSLSSKQASLYPIIKSQICGGYGWRGKGVEEEAFEGNLDCLVGKEPANDVCV